VIDAKPSHSSIQRLPLDQGGGPPPKHLTEDAGSDAIDRPRAGVSASRSAVALSVGRTGSLVGTRQWWPGTRGRVLIGSSGLLALALSYWLPEPYRLIYNASGSVPTGFYLTAGRSIPRRGALMLVVLPERWRALAATRGYLPRDVMALKRIVAGPGDVACGDATRTFLNGHLVATRASRDAMARSLPNWTGCVRLGRDQWFVLNPNPQSFDSRYIGPIPSGAFRAEVVPL